jgi:hypothetical protein
MALLRAAAAPAEPMKEVRGACEQDEYKALIVMAL